MTNLDWFHQVRHFYSLDSVQQDMGGPGSTRQVLTALAALVPPSPASQSPAPPTAPVRAAAGSRLTTPGRSTHAPPGPPSISSVESITSEDGVRPYPEPKSEYEDADEYRIDVSELNRFLTRLVDEACAGAPDRVDGDVDRISTQTLLEAVWRINGLMLGHDDDTDENPSPGCVPEYKLVHDKDVCELMLALRAVKLGRQLAQLKDATRNDPFGDERFLKTLALVNGQFPLTRYPKVGAAEILYRDWFWDYMFGENQERIRRPKPSMARIKELVARMPSDN
ncbi:hypothetical protein AMAG_16297 [Allomyces macrogynus ATCC 38327]|uniref:Uncharacterized protein n=1 Tax=Allomyces macrogynus (strain ATCC 38327) TaxID=578462 RepID=A0A0L0TAM8_ALLM3|nr:hypothetical protein AMAG_16297 [Allomyces macrogynus ATCC 38327]|eukprot:KNE71868.1 hypothetical protein AMAG_16297 [Allomyces macrogynus ATCC 38327]